MFSINRAKVVNVIKSTEDMYVCTIYLLFNFIRYNNFNYPSRQC